MYFMLSFTKNYTTYGNYFSILHLLYYKIKCIIILQIINVCIYIYISHCYLSYYYYSI